MKNEYPPVRDRGSFRDPSGYIFLSGSNVYRTVNAIAMKNFSYVLESGVIAEMISNRLLISTELVNTQDGNYHLFSGARGEIPQILLKHPKVPFVSYAYEWTFSQLKDAALAHLDLQIACLQFGVTLSDASTFNMQFVEGEIQHIDVLSLRAYKDGEPWVGYNQFCRLFIAPLLVEAWAGIPFHSLLKGRLEGLDLNEVSRILPKGKLWTSLNGLLHIALQSNLIAKANSSSKSMASSSQATLPKHRYLALLKELRNWIASLQTGRKIRTYWNSYAIENTYSNEMRRDKHEFVRQWFSEISKGIIWDIGGNTGEYSKTALQAGASMAVVFDTDLDSLEKAYADSKKKINMLPIRMDLADPSPRQGWNQQERAGLNERNKPDGLIALAIIHHLAIGRNIPLEELVDWLVNAAPYGVIEFVPKSDPMVLQMMLDREDVFCDYTEENFMQYVTKRAEITRQHRFSGNDRLILSYKRK